MSDASTTAEAPPLKTMRRFFEGRLAERLLLAGNMAADRALLRRGARKMQDGTLGQPDGIGTEDETVHIRIGDDYYHQDTAQPPQTQPAATAMTARTGLAQKLGAAALVAALLGSGGAAGYLASWLSQPQTSTSTANTTVIQPGQELGVAVVPGGAAGEDARNRSMKTRLRFMVLSCQKISGPAGDNLPGP